MANLSLDEFKVSNNSSALMTIDGDEEYEDSNEMKRSVTEESQSNFDESIGEYVT